MRHILAKSYFSEDYVIKELINWSVDPDLCGNDPSTFWRNAEILDIQQAGSSQKEMVAQMTRILADSLGIIKSGKSSQRGNDFIYLDDFLFSGGRLSQDVAAWIASEAPPTCNLHVVLLALHTSGSSVSKKLVEFAQSRGKTLQLRYWTRNHAQNTRASIRNSDVLWPCKLPDDQCVNDYLTLAKKELEQHNRKLGKDFKLLRRPNDYPSVGKLGLFSSDFSREFIEEQMLVKGCMIRQLSKQLPEIERPLGHNFFPSFGFGGLFLTYQNCPNNCPLAWWVGDPWIPLFPRRTNRQSASQENIARAIQGSSLDS
jgi:hypothetical protein